MEYTDQEKRSLRGIFDFTNGRGMFRINTDTKKPYSYGHWNPEDYDYDDGGVPRWYKIPPLPAPLFEKHLKENGVFAATPAFWNIAVVDVDHGCPDKTIEHIGIKPIHACTTKRGTHLFYAVPDADSVKDWSARTGEVRDATGNLIFGGEIASVRRYAKIHDPNDFWTAVSFRDLEEECPLPQLPDLLNIGYSKDKQKSALIGTAADASEIERQVEEIAAKLGLTKDGGRWIGGCPNCGHGDSGTRFQIKAGYAKPLMICRSCSPEGFDPAKIRKVFDQAGIAAPVKESPQRYKIIARKDNPIESACEAIEAMNYRFKTLRYGMIPMLSKDGGEYEKVSGGGESKMWRDIGNRCYWETGAGDKRDEKPFHVGKDSRDMAILALSNDDLYDPVKDWLDGLPEWDGVKRLDTMMQDCGMTIIATQTLKDGTPVDVSAWAQSYFPIEIVRFTYFPGAVRKGVLVLYATQGDEGKSSIGKMILPEDLQRYSSDKFRLSMDDQARAMICIRNKILEVREFSVFKRGDWDDIKGTVNEVDVKARLPYGKYITEFDRHDCMYVSTNRANMPNADTALHRRFTYVQVTGNARRKDETAWYELDDIMNGHTRRDWIFAEAKARVMAAKKPANFTMFPSLKPVQWMEFNQLQGGSFETEASSLSDDIDAAIEEMIVDEENHVTEVAFRNAVVNIRHDERGDHIPGNLDMDIQKDIANLPIVKLRNAVKENAANRRAQGKPYLKTSRGERPRAFILIDPAKTK